MIPLPAAALELSSEDSPEQIAAVPVMDASGRALTVNSKGLEVKSHPSLLVTVTV
jgi:hypothetical protein